MENTIHKKDNTIIGLKKRAERFNENDYLSYTEREIYIIEPAIAVNQIHDELLLYKQIHDSLMTNLKENKASMIKYEKIISVKLKLTKGPT
jgi:hypothetical protein